MGFLFRVSRDQKLDVGFLKLVKFQKWGRVWKCMLFISMGMIMFFVWMSFPSFLTFDALLFFHTKYCREFYGAWASFSRSLISLRRVSTCSSRIRLILSLSLRVLCLAFLSRIYIAVASLLNGLIDILLDFYVLCPWNFSFFISLSFFLCRDLCTDIWLVGRLRRWLETKEIGPKVSFIILVF